jgi:hypothetical protein
MGFRKGVSPRVGPQGFSQKLEDTFTSTSLPMGMLVKILAAADGLLSHCHCHCPNFTAYIRNGKAWYKPTKISEILTASISEDL